MTSTISRGSFLSEVAAAEQQNPLPVATDAAFAAAAAARGAAVSQLISNWLATAPSAMLQELLDQPPDKMPIFKPMVGPAIVMRHAHVIRCLERTDLFSTDLYAGEMSRATDDKTKNHDAFSHFLLGTDRDELYRLDDVILRRVMSRNDEQFVSTLARHEAESWTRRAKENGTGEIDLVSTIATFVPLRIVGDYIGIHYYDRGEPSVLPGLRGGDSFALDEELEQVFTFGKIQVGRVPTADDLQIWVKDAFRNIFNNFNPVHPLFAEFRERGVTGIESLAAYTYALLRFYKSRLQRGEAVPDTMLTRLLRLQLDVNNGDAAALEQELATLLGHPLPPGELVRRLSDSMIRSNVFGTASGAVVNPQEATARILDAMLRLKDGEYEVLNDSTYERAVELAAIDEADGAYPGSLQRLRQYALEALRLRPQGEVVLRLCVRDNAELGGILIRKGTPVFVAYAAAMRDPAVVTKPLAFDSSRNARDVAYLGDRERVREAPQSQLYLQHGYGRHKCLGRYASEITMQESLRALLRVGRLERRSALEMDAQNLYAVSLRVGFH